MSRVRAPVGSCGEGACDVSRRNAPPRTGPCRSGVMGNQPAIGTDRNRSEADSRERLASRSRSGPTFRIFPERMRLAPRLYSWGASNVLTNNSLSSVQSRIRFPREVGAPAEARRDLPPGREVRPAPVGAPTPRGDVGTEMSLNETCLHQKTPRGDLEKVRPETGVERRRPP